MDRTVFPVSRFSGVFLMREKADHQWADALKVTFFPFRMKVLETGMRGYWACSYDASLQILPWSLKRKPDSMSR